MQVSKQVMVLARLPGGGIGIFTESISEYWGEGFRKSVILEFWLQLLYLL